ncbi:MAG: preprotein translocase subunit SecA [bacterium]|nr:preprotein translocase subunit SecA [bacterium]
MSIVSKIFGDANEKYVKKLQPQVDKINSLEKEFESFSDERLKEKTQQLKEKLGGDPTSAQTDDILPEAFALVREAAKRTLNQRHFDVQLMGGIVLHQGKIAEMRTGEGKTLVATLPAYLNALEGKGVHVITVNDYLAKRDAVWMGQIYHLLGLSIGCIIHDAAYIYDPEANKDKERDALGGFKVIEDYLRPCSRKEAYAADITYGTNNEYGFDYLRDNMAYDLSQQVQRGHSYAIVDEVDSILIDEARTPLIISAPDMESSKWYHDFAKIIPSLDSKADYEVDEKMKAVTLTEQGINKVEKILGMGSIYEEKGIKYVHHLEQSLRAEVLFKKDRDYVVKDGEVIIVDEFTGRLMPGRRWSGGLHQAVEAKEGVAVQPESLTLASVTFQNYFRMYKKLSGMTGTAATSAEEFDKVYGLDAITVPTNKPMKRQELPDRIYKSENGKFKALVREIKERHVNGQPILVGTTSIVKNEYLGKLLDIEGIPHQILNAKNHEKEGEIIAQAGKLGAVTIATNMAGRGVDIILGGNPQNDPGQMRRVAELGGLHVIGTERHEARRIDNQLRGRSGRQGDPGSSQFFTSLEDDLMRIFGGEKIKSLMGFLKIPEDEPIEAKMISGAIESAQSKIEGMNFDLRKHLLDYDDVLNKHREVIYKKRRELLEIKDLRFKIKEWIKTPEEEKAFEEKEKELGENFNPVAKTVALRTLDMLWMEHLEEMEALRDSVRLRAYGQQDPLVEYKTEGHRMFKKLLDMIEANIAQTILKVSLKPQSEGFTKSLNQKPLNQSVNQSVGRNDLCPCGSGKKFKRCGLINSEEHQNNVAGK